MSAVRRLARSAVRRLRENPPAAEDPLLEGTSPADREVLERALRYSMTPAPRMLALIDAVRYCVARGIPGAFAECGVWLGGSVLAMLLTLQQEGVQDRDVYLFDTFSGMTAPSAADTSRMDPPALQTWNRARHEQRQPWQELFDPAVFNEPAVRALLAGSGYPEEHLHFVRGPVEETLPEQAPQDLALLRLDTDWYESTRHEMAHLFPRLSPGGVLIVDDFGHWDGARRAVEEYFATEHPPVLLHRIDYTARIAIRH